jgi:hypothetical protein
MEAKRNASAFITTDSKCTIAAAPSSSTTRALSKRHRSTSNSTVFPAEEVAHPSLSSTSASNLNHVADNTSFDAILSALQLQPHPEGGFYKRT